MDCKCLIHPFQNDPGTSQSQRVMDELLSGAVKIDARTMADLLNYFVQMSRHINFYDTGLNVNDWQPFFKNSAPFTLASIINFPLQNTEINITLYKSAFDKKPTIAGLQLIAFSVYYRFIYNINEWHKTLNDSGLPIAANLESLIKSRLQAPVKQFIMFSNAAVKNYGISRIDFLRLFNNPVWGLDSTALTAVDTTFSAGTVSSQKKLINLYSGIYTLLTVFSDSVKTLAAASGKNLEGSLIPLKEELQKKHPPHLALLFTFLNMFRQLQDDLNQYTRRHLDYFYKDILQFKAEDAIPDRANIVFEIQKALKNYLVKKGLKVKSGKDENKQEILFALDDDLVVNQTVIAEKRTLFLNNQMAHAQTYVEGIYMAPVAEMADGMGKEFESDPKNFPTLGAHFSKYIDPETKFVKPYPNARIGFILASPVLSLQTGSTRHIHIDLSCTLLDSVCPDPEDAFLRSTRIFQYVQNHINRRYVYLSEDKFKLAIQKGFTKEFIDAIREKFLKVKSDIKPSYCDIVQFNQEGSFFWFRWNNFINPIITDPVQRKILDVIFPKEKILNLSLSGEKEWIIPTADDYTIGLDALGAGNTFTIKIDTTLSPEKDSIVSYNIDILGEDYGTTQPLVKVQLNDRIKGKLEITPDPEADKTDQSDCCHQSDKCCLLKKNTKSINNISYYHFFRNVKVNQIDNSIPIITVEVCGLKNFIVQNDESLMDVNNLIYPFGARPKLDSNFLIGSEEIFIKKWTNIYINLNWKDKPANFKEYYNGYQDYWINTANPPNLVTEGKFEMQLSVLQDGKWWLSADPNLKLFQPYVHPGFCKAESFTNQFNIDRVSDFGTSLDKPDEEILFMGYKRLDVNTRHSFIKITLKGQDFQHDKYSFVLARQMAALGKLPDILDGAVYFGFGFGVPPHFVTLDVPQILQDIMAKSKLSLNPDLILHLRDLITNINSLAGASPGGQITNQIWNDLFIVSDPIFPFIRHNLSDPPYVFPPDVYLHSDFYNQLADILTWLQGMSAIIEQIEGVGVVIPKEPWTPTISNITMDYSAFASLENVDLIHLYPYPDSFKNEEIGLTPSLFPSFCDEGTLFLGLKDLVPGENLNILFQMAEATSDSESDKETVYWHYLDSNIWKPLRTGFEVLDDGTKNLTSTGIIKLSLPANMTKDNTVLPKDLHWIKATIPQNSGSVSETSGILPQAIQVIFTPLEGSDKLRLSKPLSEKISKLAEADASVKSVTQPYDSFGGLVPEIEQQFYVRVSETLRHKGRAIQAFDYERLVLQAFPQLFKVKCVNHSFALNAHEYTNDFPYAGGYVLLAVIPDLNQLKAGNSYEPKVPVSIIEDINAFIRKRTSPFVRFRAMNPRYEKINFCLTIRLMKGKDENYYKEQAIDDIRKFLAPWAIGDYYKLTFGQCVYRSDIIQLLETRDYVDFISDLLMGKEGEDLDGEAAKICPTTPRSILIAGSIAVNIDQPDCDQWGNYVDCGKHLVERCATKPEIISDYCKKQIKKQIDG